MPYTSSSLVYRARSLADLPNTTFISYQDELDSINEAYRLGYTLLTENNDDFFVNTQAYTIDTSTLTLNNVYSVTLPDDFFALRLVSYSANGQWQNMGKFSMSQFNQTFTQPLYRIQGTKLLIKQSPNYFFPNIQIQYYPKPATLYKPKPTLTYLSTVLDTSTISSPFAYTANAGTVDETDYMVYIQSKAIKVTSIKTGNTSTLLAAGAPSIGKVAYFGGLLYYISATSIYKATTDFTTLGTPVLVSGADNVTNFSLCGTALIYNNGSAIKSLDLVTGAVNTSTGITSGTLQWITLDNGATFRWIESGNINNTTIAADYLYKNDGKILFVKGFNLYELTSNTTTSLIRSDIYLPYTSGELFNGYIGTAGKYPVSALGIDPDTLLTFPTNMFWEYISYLSAIDFKMKQNADPTMLASKLQELKTTLEESLDRDEYTVARINNAYAVDWNLR